MAAISPALISVHPGAEVAVRGGDEERGRGGEPFLVLSRTMRAAGSRPLALRVPHQFSRFSGETRSVSIGVVRQELPPTPTSHVGSDVANYSNLTQLGSDISRFLRFRAWPFYARTSPLSNVERAGSSTMTFP